MWEVSPFKWFHIYRYHPVEMCPMSPFETSVKFLMRKSGWKWKCIKRHKLPVTRALILPLLLPPRWIAAWAIRMVLFLGQLEVRITAIKPHFPSPQANFLISAQFALQFRRKNSAFYSCAVKWSVGLRNIVTGAIGQACWDSDWATSCADHSNPARQTEYNVKSPFWGGRLDHLNIWLSP